MGFFCKVLKILKARKTFQKPPCRDIIVFDREGSEIFLEYFESSQIEILDVRFESFNIYVLAKCVVNGRCAFIDYVSEYIKLVNPKVVITLIDNNASFYKLKQLIKHVQFISIQNGLRSNVFFNQLRVENSSRSNSADYILTFGSAIALEYAKLIDAKVFPIGSFRCNMTPVAKSRIRKNVCFSSQHRIYNEIEIGEKIFSFENFSGKADRTVLLFLKRYCCERGIDFNVAGCSNDPSEELYFSNILGTGWHYHPKKSAFDSYQLMDTNEVFLVIDCTMGLESLAKRNKTAIFSVRSHFINEDSYKFGWPLDLPDKGPFWTNVPDESHFSEIMDYLLSVERKEWETVVDRYVGDLIKYDPGNTKFVNILSSLNIKAKSSSVLNAP